MHVYDFLELLVPSVNREYRVSAGRSFMTKVRLATRLVPCPHLFIGIVIKDELPEVPDLAHVIFPIIESIGSVLDLALKNFL